MTPFRMPALTQIALAVSLSLGWAPLANSQTSPPSQEARVKFSIAAQPMPSALEAFARQAGVRLLYPYDKVAELASPAVEGELTRTQALTKLLAGSGLVIESDQGGVIALRRADAPSPPASSNAAPPTTLQRVEVTGSRLSRAAEEGAQPTETVTSDQIRRSGQTTLAGVLSTLSQASLNVTETNTQTLAGGGSVRLRGLPVGATLVLLNGRRVEGSGPGAAYGSYFDLNTIPIAAIERIEVVPDGSSAVYGSDAIAGVVNVILKREVEGTEATLRHGSAAGGKAGETTESLVWGTASEHAGITAVASHMQRNELQGADRRLPSSDDFRPYGGRDMRVPYCNPGNILSPAGQNLPGLSSSFAAVPSVPGAATISDFVATAGTRDTCSVRGRYNSLVPESQRSSVLLTGYYTLSPSVELFGEAMYSHVDQNWFNYPPLLANMVPASNAFNPFGVPVVATYLVSDAGRGGLQLKTDFSRVLAGAKGRLGGRWEFEVAGWQSRDSNRVDMPNTIDQTKLAAALASSDPTTAWNVFGSGPVASAASLRSVLYTDRQRSTGELDALNAFVRGPVFELPGGVVEALAGLELSHHKLDVDFGQAVGQTSPPQSLGRQVRSIFTEMRVPIVGGANHAGPALLLLTAAARRDHYSDFGAKTTPQLGLELRPRRDLLVRATVAEAYKAPDLLTLYGTPIATPQLLVDPLRGGQPTPVLGTIGGNPKLGPQTGKSHSLGFVWVGGPKDALNIGLTFWDVREKDRITLPDVNLMLQNPVLFAGRITRVAPTPADVAAGYPGALSAIDASYINLGELHTSGVDLSAGYAQDTAWGRFTPSLRATYVDRYEAGVLPGQPLVSRLARASTDAYAPRLKANASLAWRLGAFSANLSARYVSAYQDYAPLANGAINWLGKYWLADANLRVGLGALGFSSTEFLKDSWVSLGAVNLFNRQPHYASTSLGYDYRQDDIRGRFVYAEVGVKF